MKVANRKLSADTRRAPAQSRPRALRSTCPSGSPDPSRCEQGQVLILFVLALGMFLGLVAMVIDVGIFLHERRSLQNAADAAALAGVQELPFAAAEAEAAVKEWAAKNGFSEGASIEITTPYDGNPTAIEVTISEQVPFMFGRVLGFESAKISARAVATRDWSARAEVALLVLNPWGGVSFDKTGGGDLIVNNGAIMVNDAWQWSIERAGAGDVISDGLYYYYTGEWYSDGTGQFLPEPQPVRFQLDDPLAELTPPDPYAIGTSPDSGGSAANPRTRQFTAGNHVLSPGTYWGGLEIRSSASVTFEPGIYVMAGGGFRLSGSGTVTGNGVFIYNTFDPENLNPNRDGRCGEINLGGTVDFTLTAPTEGPYEDILFWQDEACTLPMKHQGGGDFTSGIYYLPNAQLQLSGSGNVGSIQIIANTVDVSGTSDLIIDFREFVEIPLPGGIRLIE